VSREELLLRGRRPAPFRRAGLFPFLILSAVLGGCQESGKGPPDGSEEAAQTLGLPSGARLHQITLGGRGSEEHAVPSRIQAFPGDGVEFLTVDHRVHTVAFIADSLTVEVQAYLESTGQMASPPLVSRGSRFLLRLQNAPLGRYFYVSEGHGGVAQGVVEVGVPPDPVSIRNSKS
jgi:plastocyanin